MSSSCILSRFKFKSDARSITMQASQPYCTQPGPVGTQISFSTAWQGPWSAGLHPACRKEPDAHGCQSVYATAFFGTTSTTGMKPS